MAAQAEAVRRDGVPVHAHLDGDGVYVTATQRVWAPAPTRAESANLNVPQPELELYDMKPPAPPKAGTRRPGEDSTGPTVVRHHQPTAM